jgi:hypothetical protein
MQTRTNQAATYGASTARDDGDDGTNLAATLPALGADGLRQQRRAVKQLAKAVDADYRQYKALTHSELANGGLDEFSNRFHNARRHLELLQTTPMGNARPTKSVLRSARSGATLVAASLTRANAVVAGALGCVTESVARTGYLAVSTAVMTPVSGVTGMVAGAVAGGALGAAASDNCAVQAASGAVLATGGLLVGSLAAAGPVISAPFALAYIPVQSSSRGSFGRKLYSRFDYLASASAHTQRKRQSTAEIARSTTSRLDLVEANIMRKAQNPFVPMGPLVNLVMRPNFGDS